MPSVEPARSWPRSVCGPHVFHLPCRDETVAFRDPPRGRQHQRQRELRRRLAQHAGRSRDQHAALARGLDIDVVEARSPCC